MFVLSLSSCIHTFVCLLQAHPNIVLVFGWELPLTLQSNTVFNVWLSIQPARQVKNKSDFFKKNKTKTLHSTYCSGAFPAELLASLTRRISDSWPKLHIAMFLLAAVKSWW